MPTACDGRITSIARRPPRSTRAPDGRWDALASSASCCGSPAPAQEKTRPTRSPGQTILARAGPLGAKNVSFPKSQRHVRGHGMVVPGEQLLLTCSHARPGPEAESQRGGRSSPGRSRTCRSSSGRGSRSCSRSRDRERDAHAAAPGDPRRTPAPPRAVRLLPSQSRPRQPDRPALVPQPARLPPALPSESPDLAIMVLTLNDAAFARLLAYAGSTASSSAERFRH
jgi:hypothetical protein